MKTEDPVKNSWEKRNSKLYQKSLMAKNIQNEKKETKKHFVMWEQMYSHIINFLKYDDTFVIITCDSYSIVW